MNKKSNVFKFSAVKIQLIAVLLLLLFNPNNVHADEIYKIFPTQQNISADKIWSIKFSQDIDSTSVNNQNIKVLDQSGNPLQVNLNCSGNTVTIKPINNYDPGKTYNILIDNIKSLKGHILNQPAKMNFTIKNDDQANENVGQGSYTLVDTHTYKITSTLTVSSEQDADFNLTCNIGTLSNSPYQKELDLKVLGPNAQITSPDSTHNQLTATSSIKAGDQIQYQIVRTVQSSGIKYIKDLSNTSGNYSNFSDYKKYTSPSDNIQSDNQEIVDKANQLFSGITNPYYKAKKAYEFVNTYMNYDLNNGNKGAVSALETGTGVCEDYSELLVALLRAGGVPARVATGFWVDNSKFNSSNTTSGDEDGHAWVEYYLPEYGWIVAEPTNIQYDNGIQTVDYDYFSNLDSSGHLISGYDSSGDNRDGTITYSYSQGSSVHVDRQVTIEKLN